MKHYGVFQNVTTATIVWDEGLYRTVDKARAYRVRGRKRQDGHQRFAFGFPFENGKAKVTDKGRDERSSGFGRRKYH